MNYLIEQIVTNLREARKRKGWSQRKLSAHSGIPQSHLSKIESGDVDLRISSLIALARAVDLELFVAPKQNIPAIKSIIKNSQRMNNEKVQILPAYHLEESDDD